MATFEIKDTFGDKYQFELKTANGETMLTSGKYESKASAESGIESVRNYATDDERYETEKSLFGSHSFELKASNGQSLGTSESYKTEESLNRGIANFKKAAVSAEVEDTTS